MDPTLKISGIALSFSIYIAIWSAALLECDVIIIWTGGVVFSSLND